MALNSNLRGRWFIVGLIFLFVAIGFSVWGFYLKCLSQDQQRILQWALSIASGFMVWTFAGSISLQVRSFINGLVTISTGGFAVWLITTYILLPKIINDPQCIHNDPISYCPISSVEEFNKTSYFDVPCDDSRNTTIEFDIPSYANVVAHNAELINQSNLSSQNAKSSIQGNKVIATGRITGLNRILGNCPGGGHATLRLYGTLKCKI